MSNNIFYDAFITEGKRVRKNEKPIYSQGAAYNKHGQLIINSLRNSDFARIKHIADSYIYTNNKSIQINEDCYFMGFYHFHFGHFLIETIPELFLATRKNKKIVTVPFSNHRDPLSTPYSNVILNLFGLEQEKIHTINHLTRFKSLEIQDRVTKINNHIDPIAKEAFLYIREMIEEPIEKIDKIYLSRSKVKDRPSSENIDKYMSSKGFYIFHPQEFSLLEQISIIKSASVIAGYDGSALHLSAFLKPGSKVYILGNRVNKNTTNINNLMGHETIYEKDHEFKL